MSSAFRRYRNTRQQYSDCNTERDDQPPPHRGDSAVDPDQLKLVIQAAVNSALAEQTDLSRQREEALPKKVNKEIHHK